MKESRFASIKYLTTVIIASMMFGACGKYEKVTEKLDFLEFETFNCDVVSVTSGDSFLCQLPDREIEKIRLAGVAILPDKERGAKKYSESILRRGRLIKVEPAKAGVDENGNIPAYVLVPGANMLNVLLVERGYAEPVKEKLNEKYMYDFIEIKSEEFDNND